MALLIRYFFITNFEINICSSDLISKFCLLELEITNIIKKNTNRSDRGNLQTKAVIHLLS